METFAGPVFASLRGSLGMTEQEYQQSLCSENCYLQFISNSKSKADFFLTWDTHTLTRNEPLLWTEILLASSPKYICNNNFEAKPRCNLSLNLTARPRITQSQLTPTQWLRCTTFLSWEQKHTVQWSQETPFFKVKIQDKVKVHCFFVLWSFLMRELNSPDVVSRQSAS